MASRQQWGNITWYLFHGIAEKIKEDKFLELKPTIINIIKSICGNLPCPDCSEHATKFLNSVNFNNIQNKNDFKIFLFKFHNMINSKTNKSQFSKEDFDNKYKNIIVSKIFQYFIKIYSVGNKSEKMMMYTAFKNKFLSELKQMMLIIFINLEN